MSTTTEPVAPAEDIEGTGQELVPTNGSPPPTVFGTDDPMEIMQRTADVANGLKQFIDEQGLSKRIGSSDHIMVEGWQMLGMMLGTTAVVTRTAKIDQGWEATAELRDRTGRVVGAGDGECLRSESTWKSRDDYALRSMAQTRAIGKAFRSVFGFIAKAAGYAPAPAEEMPPDEPAAATTKPRTLHLTKRQREQFNDALHAYLDAGLGMDRLELKLVQAGAENTKDIDEAIACLEREPGKALYEWLLAEVETAS